MVRSRGRMRSGFTLIEMMVTLFITLIVMGAVGTFLIGSHRLVKGAYAEAELSLQLRMLREKLLFHVAPPHGGTVWSGLLSGKGSNPSAVVENSIKVRMSSQGIATADGSAVSQTIELLKREETSADGSICRWLGNDGDRVDDQWQRPYLRQCPNYLPSDWLDDSVLSMNIFFLTLHATMNGYGRSERIAIPLFGSTQVKGTGGVFHGH